MTRHPSTVESIAIEAAKSYAAANGFSPEDRNAVGLVLAGMAIGAGASMEARQAILSDYLDAFPEAARPVLEWARSLSSVAIGWRPRA